MLLGAGIFWNKTGLFCFGKCGQIFHTWSKEDRGLYYKPSILEIAIFSLGNLLKSHDNDVMNQPAMTGNGKPASLYHLFLVNWWIYWMDAMQCTVCTLMHVSYIYSCLVSVAYVPDPEKLPWDPRQYRWSMMVPRQWTNDGACIRISYTDCIYTFNHAYIRINYNNLTATSLESWWIREIIPKWP